MRYTPATPHEHSAFIRPDPQVHHDDAVGNDKSVSVPAGKVWANLWVNVVFTSDSSGGNSRQIVMRMLGPDGDVLFETQAATTQGADAVGHFHWINGVGEPVATKAGEHYLPLPNKVLLAPDWSIRVFDSADVSSGDTLELHVVYQQFGAG